MPLSKKHILCNTIGHKLLSTRRSCQFSRTFSTFFDKAQILTKHFRAHHLDCRQATRRPSPVERRPDGWCWRSVGEASDRRPIGYVRRRWLWRQQRQHSIIHQGITLWTNERSTWLVCCRYFLTNNIMLRSVLFHLDDGRRRELESSVYTRRIRSIWFQR